MCGIFGWQWVTPPDTADRLVLGAALASLNDERGGDSWGYAFGHNQLDKGIGYFGRNRAAREIHKHNMLIGHCRYKTVGVVKVENAHPFVHGRVTGAHNGGVFNKYDLDKSYNRNFDVDSQHIFQHIEEDRWPIEDMRGYGTIEYFHQDYPGSIFLGRFANGDLAIARVAGRGLVWSSTRHHLEAALAMAGMDGAFIKLAERIIYELRDGVIHRTKFRINVDKVREAPHTPPACGYQQSDYYGGASRYAANFHSGASSLRSESYATDENEKYELVGYRGERARFQAFYKRPYAEQVAFLREVEQRRADKDSRNAPPKPIEENAVTTTALTVVDKRNNKTTYRITDSEKLLANDEIRASMLKSAAFMEEVEASGTFDITHSTVGECEYCDHHGNYKELICKICLGCVGCCGTTDVTKLLHVTEAEDIVYQQESNVVCTICTGVTSLPLTECCKACLDCCQCEPWAHQDIGGEGEER